MQDLVVLRLGQIERRPAVDAVLVLVVDAPLHALGRDVLRAVRHVLEEQLPHRQRLQRLVAHDADIDLAAFDVLLDDRRGADAFVDERHALFQLLVGVDHRGLRDADGRLLRERFHDERERQALVAADRPARTKHVELGHMDAVIRQELFRQRLVAREQQAARIASGVRHLQQLEVADDVLVEDRHIVERLEQVEGDVGLPLVVGAADVAKVVVHRERPDFVAHAGQRRDDVVLRAPGRRLDVCAFFELVRRNEMPVHQREHA